MSIECQSGSVKSYHPYMLSQQTVLQPRSNDPKISFDLNQPSVDFATINVYIPLSPVPISYINLEHSSMMLFFIGV